MQHVIDIDDQTLAAAAAALGTTSPEETITRALERAAGPIAPPFQGVLERAAAAREAARAEPVDDEGENFLRALDALVDLGDPEVMRHAWRRQP